MAAVEVSVVALGHVCRCPGAIRDRPGMAIRQLAGRAAMDATVRILLRPNQKESAH